MAVSAEMYIVISLMFAVFAAVAAVGTSVVLGVGFERLRAGFELVKKQTGFFSEAIHKLDEKTRMLDEQQLQIKESVSHITTRVDRVEKQTEFFADAFNSAEGGILRGSPSEKAAEPQREEETEVTIEELINEDRPVVANAMDWKMTSETGQLLRHKQQADMRKQEQATSNGLSNLLLDYLRSEGREVVYH
jgi:hypothetical protein